MDREIVASVAGAVALVLAAQAVAQESGDFLEEVIVTATRQVETVNRVPLSIQAVTQENLDQQGIKNSADLVRAVPGLATVPNPGGSQQTFSIRGIVGGTGAARRASTSTTRISPNAPTVASARTTVSIAPLLYDLERVEVLKGPQGTLYGGSSQGGTVRYITPMPSLTGLQRFGAGGRLHHGQPERCQQ